jgi:signal transduction histidine kinase
MASRRAGLEREVLTSLALVMGLATLVLLGLIVVHHERTLQNTLGPALLAEARAGVFTDPALPGTEWWEWQPGARFEARSRELGAPDLETRRLAEQAQQRGAALLRLGGLGDEIRFATPIPGQGRIAVARLPQDVARSLRARPLGVVAVLGAADLAIFTAFAALLLRRRVVLPLQGLAEAARAVGAGQSVRAAVSGPRETAEVAEAWNEMTEALEQRSEDLEKAVSELRGTNRELRRTRAGLDRAERLATVGRLAAGVAHEVGNPIGAILAFVELAGRDPGLSVSSRSHLARAAREGERVRVILRQLLDFSRPTRAASEPFDLCSTAEEAADLVAVQQESRGIQIDVHREGASVRAPGDADAALQILLNLVLNAAHAVQGTPRAAISIEVRDAFLHARAGDAEPTRALRRAEADAVECVIADNGCGIPAADRERVFDPFFTTQPPGRGTGLGLSTAVRMAEEMEGSLQLVDPPSGFVTAFSLRLPAARQAQSGAPSASARQRSRG